MRMLIIDDSRAMRTLLTSYARELAFETVDAADGKQALEQLRKYPSTEIALVDWDMPVMNGLEFVKAVRAQRSYDDIKLMMVTAQTASGAVEEALLSGANDFLMKPLTKEMLEDKLRILGFGM